jgi:ribosomal protein L30E
MVKKQKELSRVEELIKENLSKNTLIFGYEITEKSLKNNKVKSIIVSNNFDDLKIAHLKHLCDLSNVEFVQAEIDARIIGELCKKPFFINVLGIRN